MGQGGGGQLCGEALAVIVNALHYTMLSHTDCGNWLFGVSSSLPRGVMKQILATVAFGFLFFAYIVVYCTPTEDASL